MRIYHVDAFTDEIFKGNPAGVCFYADNVDDIWMQNMAYEMNLSETAFLTKKGEEFNLKWFTPEKEVDLCGHATLASAHVLWESGELDMNFEAVFHTKSGILKAKKADGYIELDFPREDAGETKELSNYIIDSLGSIPVFTGRNRMDYILEFESEKIVLDMKPDMSKLKKLDARGVIITSISRNEKYDFISRFFAPGYGIDEDPVTGSAHCCLAPYWAYKLNKNELNAYQASKRGGEIKLRLDDKRVYLMGKAKTVFAGNIFL